LLRRHNVTTNMLVIVFISFFFFLLNMVQIYKSYLDNASLFESFFEISSVS